MENQDGLIVGW